LARRLILDTGVLISSERSRSGPEVAAVAADDDVVIAAITVAELRTGVELANDEQRAGRSAFVDRVLQTLPLEPYDIATAQAHAQLLAHVHRSGSRPGAHQLIIAATAVVTGRSILTNDRKSRFAELPGVSCVEVGGTPVAAQRRIMSISGSARRGRRVLVCGRGQ